MWEVKTAQDEAVWTEDYLSEVLSSHARRPLPADYQRIGSVEIAWIEPEPGKYAIRTQGGTVDDGLLARFIVRSQLDAYGMTELSYEMPAEIDPSQHLAAREDVETKAARLMNTPGAVAIGRNSPTQVAAKVVGDHGTYNLTFDRMDPNSNAITTWKCECEWDQFAWQRTRKWKKYEGRPCSHVLAAYWTALKLPFDEEYDPQTGLPMTEHGQLGLGAPGMAPSTTPAPTAQRPSGGPTDPSQQLSIPGIAPGTAEATPPVPAHGIIPPFQGYPKPPVPVSVPGAKVPDPTNPTQYPGGTFSSVQYPMDLDQWSPPQWHFQAAEDIGPQWFPVDVNEWAKTAFDLEHAWADIPTVGWKFAYDTRDGRGILSPQYDGYDKTYHDEIERELVGNSYDDQVQLHTGVVGTDGLVYVWRWPNKPAPGANLEDLNAERFPPRLLQWIQQTVPNARYPADHDELLEAHNVGQRLAAWPDDEDDPWAEPPFESHNLEWKPGVEGRGILRPNGEVHTWGMDADYDDNYHHDYEYYKDFKPGQARAYFYITEDGRMHGTINEEARGIITQAEPRLRYDDNVWRFGAKGDTYENSDMVRLEKEEYGVMEGKSEAHGAGQYRLIPRNSIGEVLGQDPTTGWVDVIFPLHDMGPMEPYHVRAWIDPSVLTPMPKVRKPGPFIRRRRERK